jgi:hypothetical protein
MKRQTADKTLELAALHSSARRVPLPLFVADPTGASGHMLHPQTYHHVTTGAFSPYGSALTPSTTVGNGMFNTLNGTSGSGQQISRHTSHAPGLRIW